MHFTLTGTSTIIRPLTRMTSRLQLRQGDRVHFTVATDSMNTGASRITTLLVAQPRLLRVLHTRRIFQHRRQ